MQIIWTYQSDCAGKKKQSEEEVEEGETKNALITMHKNNMELFYCVEY
jgi:hypothetical protein